MIDFDLTADEQKNVRAALAFLRHRLGTWKTLAKVLKMKERSLTNVANGRTATPMLAFKIAKLGSVTFEDVTSGRFPSPGTCPHCGRGPDGEPIRLAGDE